MTYIRYRPKQFRDKTWNIICAVNEVIREAELDGYILSIRQIYYALVSANIIKNEEKSYKNLINIIRDARYAGEISWTAIEDRGRFLNDWLIQENQREALRNIETKHYARDLWTPQNVYAETWVEKDAQANVIERPCSRFRVPYLPCRGYLSTTEAWLAGQRFEPHLANGKRCVIIHLGDHDPSGMNMTEDNFNRIEDFTDGGVEVIRVALNLDQIQLYKPPHQPLKTKKDGSGKHSDTRAKKYYAEFGNMSWELDALKPAVIDRLLSDTFQGLIANQELWDKTLAEEAETRQPLAALHVHWPRVRNYLANIMFGKGTG